MSLHVIFGPMKSGKSLELIARIAPYEVAGKRVAVVQSARHVREAGIRSRLGLNHSAKLVQSLSEVSIDKVDIIAVDEIHMFPVEDAKFIKKWRQEKYVIVSGLDTDSRGELMPIAIKLYELQPDEVMYKQSVCENCKALDARYTQVLKNGQAILSGLPSVVPEDGSYEYQALCYRCFQTNT